LNLALDISVATGKPLEAVTNALGKAYDGNATSLGRLGLGLDSTILKGGDTDAIFKSLTDTFGNFAENEALTTEAQFRRVGIAVDEAKESIGAALLPIVERLANDKPITCRFVFKIKRDSEGNIIKFKARLVAQGFKQIMGINYYETYSPVAKISTLRLTIAIASINNMHLHHIDINTAYINADLEEKILMCPPPGMIIPDNHVLQGHT
jgi:hypothetical protein